MADRVLVERLRPQTQQEVVVRPVDTYIRPAPVQEGNLAQLAKFVERLEPRFSRLMQAKFEEQKEEDKVRAREIAETTTASYDDLVAEGKIDPSESPVFRFAFNETRGQVAGYEFIQEASEAYMRSGMSHKADASSFDDWYNQYYQEYVDNNQGVLGLDGAYDQFSRVAGQARNNLLNQHLGDVRKNFAAQTAAAYNNFIFGQLDNADFSTPEGIAAFTAAIGTKQGDLASSGGGQYSYTRLNAQTVDAVIAYYRTKGFDTQGMENALSVIGGGTGALGGTAYARTEIAKARVEFARERLAAEQREETMRGINESRTQDNINQIFFSEFMQGNYNTDSIYEQLPEELKQQFMTYYPQGMAELTATAESFMMNRYTEPMAPAAIADIREELESIPARERVARVIDLAKTGRISDTSVYNSMMSFATSSRDAEQRGQSLDATKDPIYKDFFDREFEANTDKYTGDGAQRKFYFQSSYYELYDRVDENGVRYWDTLSAQEKLQHLYGIITSVNEAFDRGTGTTQDPLFDDTRNSLQPQLGADGRPMYINGKPVFQVTQ